MDLGTLVWGVIAAASLGLVALWVYAVASIARSMKAIRKAKRLVKDRPCSQEVSVIIAARNEAKRLEKLLPSLLSSFTEVIVVDDESTDETPRLLRQLESKYQGLQVLRVDEVPGDWAPKTYALSLGASRARGDVLLFLDADTEPWDPVQLRCIAARIGNNEVLGLVPRFLCETTRCAAIEAAVTATAYGFYGLHRVMDPEDKLTWMYGCCWAIKRTTYKQLGGHEAVKKSYVEDRDFANVAKKRGARILLLDARETIGVWTYSTASEYAWLIARLLRDPLRRRTILGRVAVALATTGVPYAPLLLALLAPITSLAMKPLLLAPLGAQLVAYSLGALIEGYNPVHAVTGIVYGQLVYPIGLLRAVKGSIYWKQREIKT